MKNFETLFDPLSLSGDSKRRVRDLLASIDSEVADAWLKNLEIRGSRITGTFYADLGAKLPYNDFVALYKAIGYDFSQVDAWQDWKCYDGGCQRKDGFSCDPNSCK